MESLSEIDRSELQVSLATFILHDGGVDITEDNIAKLVKSAGGEIAPYWAKSFAELLAGKDVAAMIDAAGAAGPSAGAAAAAVPAAGAGDAADAEAAAPPEEEEEDESSDAMGGGGLFGDSDSDSDSD